MTKQEYLDILLKRDFIEYVLLQNPHFSNEEISNKLKSKIDADLLYERMKVHVSYVIDKHLSKAKVKDEKGNIVDILPDWLNPGIVDVIVQEFSSLVETEYSMVNFLPDILLHIERLTWVQGVDDMALNLQRCVKDLNATADHYAKVNLVTPDFYELKGKYEAAKRITVREQIMQDNDKDVSDFLEALTLYCQDLCVIKMSLQLSKLYRDIATSKEITTLIRKFSEIHSRSVKERESLNNIESNEEWNEEYRTRFPMDFYKRNVEDIDASKAFQMVFLISLAHHEDILKKQGYISPDGEIILFTNPKYDGSRWMNVNFFKLLCES